MEYINGKFRAEYYNEDEIKKMIIDKEPLYFLDTGMEDMVVREQDIPDAIESFWKKGVADHLEFYDVNATSFKPALSTLSDIIETVEPELRDKIIGRLTKIQYGEEEVKDFKIIDSDMYERIKDDLEFNEEEDDER